MAMITPLITPPAHLLPWLTHTTYLMQELKKKAGDAHLDILSQSWAITTDWDQHILHLDDELVLHRDVVILAYETPCWFARTILPATTYQTDELLFERLEREPLGNIIFNNTAIERVSLRYYPIDPSDAEYTWIPASIYQGQKKLWMRLSQFAVHHKTSFYLVEIFLPGLEKYS
ncbi:MAG TPA: chorismate lyase [Legionellaceae bacterium]|nr:chorismate lyase [Legionellaceae bacterium]